LKKKTYENIRCKRRDFFSKRRKFSENLIPAKEGWQRGMKKGEESDSSTTTLQKQSQHERGQGPRGGGDFSLGGGENTPLSPPEGMKWGEKRLSWREKRAVNPHWDGRTTQHR